MNYLKISVGIFLALAASRFIPHPPNFTSLIALSFYIPLIFGVKFIPILIFCFVVSDFFIGFHSITFFTWGSVLIIGLITKFFKNNIFLRLIGVVSASLIFFIFSNFGVWVLGSYGYSYGGLITCYIAAIPFYTNTLLSTIIYSVIIETILNFYKSNKKNLILKN
ncbi:hypothetical protein OAQ82_03220 [Candidatus Pelagibacter sp.]|nr:hypothetical protein [Candidatus Pelagibacter sp.]